jgi:cell division protein FtsQ
MSRSVAAAPAGRRVAGPGSRRTAHKPSGPPLGILRPLSRAASVIRMATAFARRRRRLRIALLAAAIALPLLACGWLWLRQSPFVAVQRVRISGVRGVDAQAVDAALTQAAHGMSTLEVNVAALRAAVAPLRVVREVRAIPSLPHGLRIDVVEQLPVAVLAAGGERTAVAADGAVLGPALASGSLPSIGASVLPRTGGHVGSASLLAELTVLGAVPAPLARHVERVFTGAKGLTVAMRDGLLVYFGDDTLPHAKWLSLARVLADSSSAGASYVDVRLPSHPAAGFPAGVTPPAQGPTAGTGSGGQAGSQESTVAALAAGLAGGSIATSSTGTEPASTASEPPAETGSGTAAPPASAPSPEPAPSEADAATAGTPAGG